MGIYVGVAQSNRALITSTMVGVGTTTTAGAGVAGTEKGAFVYNTTVDEFQGFVGTKWLNISDNFSASGGTEETPGDGYKYHVYASPGSSTFVINSGTRICEVLVVGGGVAGLEAIAPAKRMGAMVFATDVRIASKEQVES